MSDKSWEEYRIYLLETIKTMNEALKTIDKRVTDLEHRCYMVMGGIGVVLFLIEMYFNLKK